MPISYVVNEAQSQIRTIVTAPVSVKEILGHLEAIQQNQILPLLELIDARHSAPPYLTVADIWNAAGAVRVTKITQPFGSRAIVVDDPVTFGLTRIFAQILSGNFPINVFRDMQTAEEWLSAQPRLQRPIQPPPTTRSS